MIFSSFHFLKKAHLLGFFLWPMLLIQGCSSEIEPIHIYGDTMGTTYTVTIADSRNEINSNQVKTGIDSVLLVVNASMSTYDEYSEISAINRQKNADWIGISEDLSIVLSEAHYLSEVTAGLFDITIMPLIRLWGFRTRDRDSYWKPPSEEKIDSVKNEIGYQKFSVDGNRFKKTDPALQLDVNALAKGFGVDKVAQYLEYLGYKNYLVEIGGEVRCSGYNQQKIKWTIGIDSPILNSQPGAALYNIVELKEMSMATSGDYRNYIIYNDQLFSHILNPITGRPTQSVVSSTTVLAPTCMLADGLATALLVMDSEAGMHLINSLQEVEALMILRDVNGSFTEYKSEGFESYIKN